MNDKLIKYWRGKLVELEDRIRKLKIDLEKKHNIKINEPQIAAVLEEEISYLKDWIEFYSTEIEKYQAKSKPVEEKYQKTEEKAPAAKELISDAPQIQKNIENSFNFIFKENEKKPSAESNVLIVEEKPQIIKIIISNIKESAVNELKSQPSWVKYIIPCIFLVLIATSVFLFKPSVTGHAVFGKETAYTENLNLKINESGAYEWNVKNPGNIKSLKVSGAVTSNGSAKVYIEKNGTKQLLFDSGKQLFDVDIHVLPEYKKIFQGDEMLVQIVLFNLRGFGSGNIKVKYAVRDQKNNFIAAEEETVFVQTQTKFVRKLIMPTEIEPGTFSAYVEASANSTIVGTGSDTFEILSKSGVSYFSQLKYYVIVLASAVAFVIVLIFGTYEFKRVQKKKEIAKLQEMKPEEKRKKLEGELKALELAYKAGFISNETYEKEKKRIENMLGVTKK